MNDDARSYKIEYIYEYTYNFSSPNVHLCNYLTLLLSFQLSIYQYSHLSQPPDVSYSFKLPQSMPFSPSDRMTFRRAGPPCCASLPADSAATPSLATWPPASQETPVLWLMSKSSKIYSSVHSSLSQGAHMEPGEPLK